MDEFALSWNNFSSNISSGFQDLFDKGFLVDCTLAVEGKLIHVHKIVLAICSPYFQEMFTTNSCKHPIVVMSPEVSHSLMKELIQFMYKGEVNVKQAELTKFMKIAESLKIKGLTTFNNLSPSKTPDEKIKPENSQNDSDKRPQQGAPNLKRERPDDTTNQNKSKQLKRNNNDESTNESLDSMTEEIYVAQNNSMDSRFDSVTIKREDSVDLLDDIVDREHAPSIRINNFGHPSTAPTQTFTTFEYPNELQPVPNDYNKPGHSSDPAASSVNNITMLSSTSLLHGRSVFNRNNTVATQNGLKTYWLCKSYRITMCRARCITHQGKVISATGVHNHEPHMKENEALLATQHVPQPQLPTQHQMMQHHNQHQNDHLLMNYHHPMEPQIPQMYQLNQIMPIVNLCDLGDSSSSRSSGSSGHNQSSTPAKGNEMRQHTIEGDVQTFKLEHLQQI